MSLEAELSKNEGNHSAVQHSLVLILPLQADHEAALDALEGGCQYGMAHMLQTVVDTFWGWLGKWPVPAVRDGRALQWRTDEEFGRAVSPQPLSLPACPSDTRRQRP